MDIKLQLRYMQNFVEEISSTLKTHLDDAYRNKIRSIINNQEITDVEKVRQMLELVQEGQELLSKKSNIDPSNISRATALLNITNATIDSLMDRSTVKDVRDVINANDYEAVNVDATVRTEKGNTQASRFLDAVIQSTRPDHEMLKAVQKIEFLCAKYPNLRRIVKYNFPNYNTNKFRQLSLLRQNEKQTLNVGISLANDINDEINKNHVDAICILSMLKRQTECANGLLDESQKKLIKEILSDDLSEDQKVNVDEVQEGYNQWYNGAKAYLMQGYDSAKITRQRKNKTRLTGEELNQLTYEARLKRILDPNELGFANHYIKELASSVESMLTGSTIYNELNNALSYLATVETKMNPNDKVKITGSAILKNFIQNSILLNIMENSNEIQADRKRNKEIIEALKFQMKEQLDKMHMLGITSYYQKIGECVENITKGYFLENGLTPINEKDNLKLYNDSVFSLAFRQVVSAPAEKAIQYKDVRQLPEYKAFFDKYLKDHKLDKSQIDPNNWPLDIPAATSVPTALEVMPEECGANPAKRISSTKDLSDEALEIRARKKKDPKPPKPPQKAKDKLISIYLIQEIMSEKGVTSDGVKDVNTFLNCAQTRIQELMVEFQTLAAAETGGDPVKLAEICEEAFVEYKSIDTNKLKVKQDMADTTANVGIKKPAHIKRRDNAKKIEVANSASSAGAMEWNQGEIKYQLVSSGGKDVVQYNFTTSSDIANIPHFAKVMLYSKILNPASLSGTSLMTNIQTEIGSEASYVISGIPTTTIPSI